MSDFYFVALLILTSIMILIYWKWFKCWHKYQLVRQVDLYRNAKSEHPFACKYHSLCTKCGKIKVTKL